MFAGSTTLGIQQDNATPHRAAYDPDDVVAARNADGWRICFENQLAKSPDLNVLDLGLLNPLQSLQQRHRVQDILALMNEMPTRQGFPGCCAGVF